MSENKEDKVADKEEPVVEEPEVKEEPASEPSVPELSPVEQQAMEQGWVPLEEWEAQGRSKDEWRPAREFVERGELYKSIHTTKRELKQTQAALNNLQRHNQYIFEKAYNQAIRDLRAEKRLAIRNEDFERLEEIETEIEELNDQHAQERRAIEVAQAQAAQPTVAPEFQVWVDRNSWYLTDQQLRDEAEAAGFLYLNKGGSKEGLLAHVEATVKKKFPERFGGNRRAAPSAVAAVDRTKTKTSKEPTVDLTPEERQIMKTFVDMGVMSEAEYIKQLKKVGR